MANPLDPRRLGTQVPGAFSFDAPDEWEDEDEDDEIQGDGTRRSRVDHLPPPPEIDGDGGYTEIDGEVANTLPGRSSSPRLFVQGAGHPTVTQLKVFRMENGLPVSLGAIGAEATEDDLVRQFSRSMPIKGEGRIQFRFRPIDGDNRELGVESSLWMSENHSAIQRMQAMNASISGSNGSGINITGLGGMPPEIFSLMSKTLDRSHASVDDERLRSRTIMDQIASERVGLANNVTTSMQSMSDRMLTAESSRASAALEAENNRNRQASDSMAAFFQSQLEMMSGQRDSDRMRMQSERETSNQYAERMRKEENDRAERERAREGQRLEREQNDWQRRLTEVRGEQESKAAAAIRDAERQDQRRREESDTRREQEDRRWQREMELMRQQREIEREEQRRREELSREETRRREETFMRAQASEREERERQRALEREEQQRRELAQQRDHEWRLKQLEIEAGQKREHDKQMAQVQQMQMAAAMQAANGAKTDLKGLLVEAAGFLTAVGVEPKDLIQRFVSPPAVETDNTGAWADLAGKVIGSVGEVAKARMITDASKNRVTRRRRMLPAQGEPLMLPDHIPAVNPSVPMAARVPSGYAPPPAQQYYASQPLPQPVRAPVAPPPEPKPIDLPFDVQRAGRVGIRKLLEQLHATPKSQWEPLITVSLMQNASIFEYIQAVSLVNALAEAGADEQFSENVIDALLESDLVPDDLNFGFDYDDFDDDEDDDSVDTDVPASPIEIITETPEATPVAEKTQ